MINLTKVAGIVICLVGIIMKKITESDARIVYEKYLCEGLRMFPPFKGVGLKLIQFAIDEPEMYHALFSPDSGEVHIDFLEKQMESEKVIPYIMKSLELNEADAKWLFRNAAFYLHGLASLITISDSFVSMEDLSLMFGTVCRGLLMQLKAPADERVGMIPNNENGNPGNLNEYIKGRKKVIIGYGSKKEMYQIRVDAILYFEAVGENVFAYTKENVYDIKQRLYKVEEEVSGFSFIRAAKSLLVNIKKISSVEPDNGGRIKIHLINGESVIASRGYAKSIVDAMKE